MPYPEAICSVANNTRPNMGFIEEMKSVDA